MDGTSFGGSKGVNHFGCGIMRNCNYCIVDLELRKAICITNYSGSSPALGPV